MKKVLENYRAYINGREKAKETLKSASKKAQSNYSGVFLKEKEAELKQNYQSTLNKLKTDHLDALHNDFEATKTRIQSVLVKPVPDEVQSVLQSMEGITLTEAEKTQLLKITENSYLARRKALDLIGLDYSTPSPIPDGIIERMNELETALNKAARNEEYNFVTAMLENGDWINQVETETSDFIGTYE